MAGIIVIFVLNDKKLSSHMAQINEHVNSSNHIIHSYDQMSKIIVNLGSKKYENRNDPTCQLYHLQNLSLLSIVNNPVFLSNVDTIIIFT